VKNTFSSELAQILLPERPLPAKLKSNLHTGNRRTARNERRRGARHWNGEYSRVNDASVSDGGGVFHWYLQ